MDNLSLQVVDPLLGNAQYCKVKDLGIGSFGSVALYTRNEGRGEPSLCAVKFMNRSGPGVDINLIQREIQSHRVLRHPHVIRFKQLGLTPTHIFMCMEFADQGDLLGFLRRKGPLPEADSRWLFQQIIFGLDYCHLKGVVNRDLKPENLLLKLTPEASKRHRKHQLAEREQQAQVRAQLEALRLHQHQNRLERLRQEREEADAAAGGAGATAGSRDPLPELDPLPLAPPLPPLGLVEHRTSNTFNLHIKIADFGLSKRAAHSLPKTRVGTINYMAPEVLLAGPAQRYDGAKADIWSAGVVLYAMLFSRVPFETPPEQQQQAAAAAGGAGAAAPGGGGGGGRDRAATIQRILDGAWAVPPGMTVSPQVLHLLTQMLQPDPARRIPMSAIMEHPWFRAGLPPAALTMNTALVRQQAQQAAAGTATSGEQPEAEIDAILDELRDQVVAEREAAAAAAAAAASASRSSNDFAAEERRNFEVRGIDQIDSPSHRGGGGGGGGRPHGTAPPRMQLPTQQAAAAAWAGGHQHTGTGAGRAPEHDAAGAKSPDGRGVGANGAAAPDSQTLSLPRGLSGSGAQSAAPPAAAAAGNGVAPPGPGVIGVQGLSAPVPPGLAVEAEPAAVGCVGTSAPAHSGGHGVTERDATAAAAAAAANRHARTEAAAAEVAAAAARHGER
ncbi:hypothetical protein CHLRE_11g477000v5 [Chlamydomonas reinhardtii]|uniref:non-specific serine/threonine protein kinase n=1 Tax=Chlamydomonas reinhardtii TaxID=3055 RepID=A0A2K3D8F8_CHLRE|nr:uncharacterized protein CHLRE_11g477000v5 [Chlamydomonas reinhardtii]PNW76806.1 hypothetical protein CHLRE_11g477000v5 [Chlamydomonas reinhardtii]